MAALHTVICPDTAVCQALLPLGAVDAMTHLLGLGASPQRANLHVRNYLPALAPAWYKYLHVGGSTTVVPPTYRSVLIELPANPCPHEVVLAKTYKPSLIYFEHTNLC